MHPTKILILQNASYQNINPTKCILSKYQSNQMLPTKLLIRPNASYHLSELGSQATTQKANLSSVTIQQGCDLGITTVG